MSLSFTHDTFSLRQTQIKPRSVSCSKRCLNTSQRVNIFAVNGRRKIRSKKIVEKNQIPDLYNVHQVDVLEGGLVQVPSFEPNGLSGLGQALLLLGTEVNVPVLGSTESGNAMDGLTT